MLKRLRRRIASDDGVTVVETMFAILVLSVALFGLMGSLIASAESQLDQRRRTQGIRVANEFLEQRRADGFDKLKADLLAGCLAGSTCAPSVRTVDGVDYTITPVVTEVDPTNPALGPQPGKATLMQVNTTVAWSARSQTRSINFTNVVSPTKPDLTKDIKNITVFPDPTVVSKTTPSDANPWGQPTQDIQLTVELKGLGPTTPVNVSWVDDQGAKGPYSLTTTDGKLWKRTIAKTLIRKVIPGMDTATLDDDEEYGDLEFLVEVDIGGGVILRQQQTLRLSRAVNPPYITPRRSTSYPYPSPTFITPTSVPLVRNGPQANRGRNTVAMVFQTQVSGLNFTDQGTTTDTVVAQWLNWDVAACVTWAQAGAVPPSPAGCVIQAPLTYQSSTGYWRRDIPANGQIFPQSVSNMTIQFLVTRQADGSTAAINIPVTFT
jgi:type II secretory pathway pseudopilin PulG